MSTDPILKARNRARYQRRLRGTSPTVAFATRPLSGAGLHDATYNQEPGLFRDSRPRRC
jgi:hypothetical protein